MKLSLRSVSALVLVSAVFLTAGCGSKKIKYADDATIHSALDVNVAWIKNKKNSIDMRVTLHNKSQTPITYTSQGVKLSYEGREAFQGENFTRTLLPDEAEQRTLVFRFESPVAKKGVATFVIDPLYAGGAGDAKNRQTLRRYYRQFELN